MLNDCLTLSDLGFLKYEWKCSADLEAVIDDIYS